MQDAASHTITVTSTAASSTAHHQPLRVVVGGSSGCLEVYEVGGAALLARPLAPCFFRAATDNDRGGSGGSSYAARWDAAGLDRLAPQQGD